MEFLLTDGRCGGGWNEFNEKKQACPSNTYSSSQLTYSPAVPERVVFFGAKEFIFCKRKYLL